MQVTKDYCGYLEWETASELLSPASALLPTKNKTGRSLWFASFARFVLLLQHTHTGQRQVAHSGVFVFPAGQVSVIPTAAKRLRTATRTVKRMLLKCSTPGRR